MRRSITGCLIREILGESNAEASKNLVTRLREVFQEDENLKISCPCKKTEIRISERQVEIAASVSAAGDCNPVEVRQDEIRSWSPTNSIWVQCLMTAARRITLTGKLKVGCVSEKVEFFLPRPLQRYRCLEPSHVREQCSSSVDRSRLYLRRKGSHSLKLLCSIK